MQRKLYWIILYVMFCHILQSLSLPVMYARFRRDAYRPEAEFLRRYRYIPASGSLDEAVRYFQRFIHTPESGRVDGETRQWMEKARCGMPDGQMNNRRKKRFALQGSIWNKTDITYQINSYSGDLPTSVEDDIFAQAFEMWNSISPITFTRETRSNVRADINIIFARGYHGDSQPFDGPGKILAHAFFPDGGGDQHYDLDENWTHLQAWGTNLLQTVVHETGHSLGMAHSDVRASVMYPYIPAYNPSFRLDVDDIFAMRAMYGDICSSEKPCKNGGRCEYGYYTTSCKCPPGFEGKVCQHRSDQCAANPCYNGGTCVSSATSYQCVCPRGFTGYQCQSRLDLCSGQPCQNGGVCSYRDSSYNCQCRNGFSGKNCENQYGHPCNDQPCQNGASCRQIEGTNSFICDCTTEYYGFYCEIRKISPSTTSARPVLVPQPPAGPYDVCRLPSIDDATITYDGTVYFFKEYYAYAMQNLRLKPGYPKLIQEEFPYMDGYISASLYWQQNGETWLFNDRGGIGVYYNRYHLRTGSVGELRGVPSNLDAAFYWPYDGNAYLIQGSRYWQFNLWNREVKQAAGDITDWGITGPVDGAIVYSGYLYFFKGLHCYKIHPPTRQVEAGYPKITAQEWLGC